MPPAIPLATYRLQLTADFNFAQAAAIAPYLKKLGITHVYASPFLKARHGSTHGYDIVDHNVLNPELGGDEGFEQLSAALKREDLGLILDFVPNHMGVHFADNPWWLDVLEWGPSSPCSASFDIDWDLLPFRTRGGILLPILGASYGDALERGNIEIRYDAAQGSFAAWYFEHRLPIAPERYSEMLRVIVGEAGAQDTPSGKQILDLASRYKGLRHPNRTEAPAFKAALAQLPGAPDIISRGLEAYRAGADRPAQTSTLHHLLERQHYRLAHWRLATSEINYRRFFDVNSLAGLRVEDAPTFERIHRLVRQLIADNKIQGLRLDHIDGLRDPAQYCRRLQRLIRDARGPSREPFYLLIEKILGEGEKLPKLPGVHGTTGYEWLNVISRVLLDGSGLDALDETFRQASNIAPDFTPVLLASKRRVLDTLLASEFTVLTRLLARIANGHYSTRDFSADSLRQVFELYVLHFPVYRTYIAAAGPSPTDRDLIAATIDRARAEWFGADEGIFDFLRSVLTMDLANAKGSATGKPRIRRFALKVQQFTGPLMAKSLEDTAFYRYPRVLALNEVGGDPAADALQPDAFHALMRQRVVSSPHGLTATATHDTKRGEDARARLLALSELAGEWTACVGRWKAINAKHIETRNDMRSPSPAFEYLLYQSLVGAWPLAPDPTFGDRMKAYAIKAAREAKRETSWLNPNEPYEKGLTDFIDRILDPSNSDFLQSISVLVRQLSLLGALNALSQITLKATMPGVPDFYQGTEFWDFSLVDPDNRRALDFAERREALEALSAPDWQDLTDNWANGRLKLAWTAKLLDTRRNLDGVFRFGSYRPIEVQGPAREHVLAYAREYRGEAAIVAVGRRFARLTDRGQHWPLNVFDGALDASGFEIQMPSGEKMSSALSLATIFPHVPAAVLPARKSGSQR
ncbi:glycosyl hydrolase [Afipia sp. Root123D2]|uniref:malto-oligosyltrehalose synthase n=1 Tax=Afipia sp. Root123D2 TaxID=1736436 RepID=UPI0006F8C34E|nr:malto-oligosyltrehalose synthase [Afipia sp. Root123D2]KQW20935.1 glycosyl hydrolase [Afipia sp. Root123D2]